MQITMLRRSPAGCLALVAVAGMSPPVPAHAAAPAAWRTCRGDDIPPGMQCATTTVPVDWRRPAGPAITLNLARLPATTPARRIGTVLIVPGGPGEDGIPVLKESTTSFAALRRRFDVVAYDPRSGNAMRSILPPSCVRPGLKAVSAVRTRTRYRAQAGALDEAVRRCRADDTTGLVDHLDSLSVARDMDAVREFAGEEKLSLLGWSYGGVPATAYARLYPRRVRAMVLDGVVDHSGGPFALERSMLPPVDQSLTRFTAWCASDKACALHGRDVRGLWRRLVKAVSRRPVTVTSPGLGTITMDDTHLKMFGGTVTQPAAWPALAGALAKAAGGDFTWFGEQALHNSQAWTMPAFMAARCSDALGYQGYDELVRGRRHAMRISADFGGGSLWESLVCSGWKQPVANPPRPLPVAGLPPLLGLGSYTDFATTEALTRKIPGSVSVRYDGPGHVMYLAGHRCMTEHADRYLTDLTLPPAGSVCRS
ncbi:alpha/beta fold hydrolase [Microbispora sp. NPDC088329]|uniref:alpha/beta fold hydrolase n=1 Tax=Microbispora sp. NPDC088329 TaxID=3154869 RepID=UPI00343F6088